MRGRLPKAGTLTGTGAALAVNVGFRPKYVRLINTTQLATGEVTDGDNGTGMAAAKTLLTVTAGTISYLASAGITLTPTGFLIGTNANLNTLSDVLYYVAF